MVASFQLDISIETDNAIGPLYDDTKTLTWRGTTEVKLTVSWKDAQAHPWRDAAFLLSTQVRCNQIASSQARSMCRHPCLYVMARPAVRQPLCLLSDSACREAAATDAGLCALQACSSETVGLDSYVYSASGASPRYAFDLGEIEQGLGQGRVQDTMTMHFYKDGVIDLDKVKCAAIRIGPSGAQAIDAKGESKVSSHPLASVRMLRAKQCAWQG